LHIETDVVSRAIQVRGAIGIVQTVRFPQHGWSLTGIIRMRNARNTNDAGDNHESVREKQALAKILERIQRRHPQVSGVAAKLLMLVPRLR
jgi:hypothetical protein